MHSSVHIRTLVGVRLREERWLIFLVSRRALSLASHLLMSSQESFSHDMIVVGRDRPS